MSAFYGMVQGNRSASTKGGSKLSGFKASAQSYDGSVITYLSYNDSNELIVTLAVAEGSSSYGDTIFAGTIEELRERLKRK